MELTGYEAITADQRAGFLREGVLLLPRVLDEQRRARLEAAVDRVHAQERAAGLLEPDGSLHLLGFLPRDEEFAELLTLPATFPYVWGLAGWNVYTHHNHLDVTPPAPFEGRAGVGLAPGRLPAELRPGAAGRARSAADAFLFDRRLRHSRSPNRSTVTRKMLFIGHTYRWIRPLDDMPIDRSGPWWANRTPVQRQLLGDAPHTANHWGVGWDGYVDEKIPLRHELQSRGLLDRSVPWHR